MAIAVNGFRTAADKGVMRASSFNDIIRQGTLRDLRFHQDGSIFPFLQIGDRIHIADDHKWSNPFIGTAKQKGYIRGGAVMTFWDKHAREDFGPIFKFPPAINSVKDPIELFHHAVEHLTRMTFNAGLIASRQVSEIIVVYAEKFAVMPLFNIQWAPSLTMWHSMIKMRHPADGRIMW